MSLKVCKCTHTKADHKGKIIHTRCHNCPCEEFVPRKISPFGLIYGISMFGMFLFLIGIIEWSASVLGRDAVGQIVHDAFYSIEPTLLFYIVILYAMLTTSSWITKYFNEKKRKDYNKEND